MGRPALGWRAGSKSDSDAALDMPTYDREEQADSRFLSTRDSDLKSMSKQRRKRSLGTLSILWAYSGL